ncbi:hypothetical protein BGX28_009390 [Mortierella sp. GBA30]|nr:hypothetical protein BGX28_009390 [Mortierella sp. GBA30]
MDVDVDDEHAQLWQSGGSPAQASYQAEASECDDYWFIPPYIVTEILVGQLQKITDESTAHLAHNAEQQRIDIWGSVESIQKAKLSLDHIGHFYFEMSQPIETVCNVLEKPSTFVEMLFVEAPLSSYIHHPYAEAPVNKLLMIKAEPVGHYGNLRSVDLRMDTIDSPTRIHDRHSLADKALPAADANANDAYVQAMKYNESMAAQNIERIREHLYSSLHQVQLMDNDLKMRIRIGQAVLCEYPRRMEWDTKSLDSTVIPDSRMKTDFSPFFSKSPETFAALAARLTPPQMQEQRIEPEVLWSLGVMKKDEESNGIINVQLDVTFRADGKVAFWNGLVQKMTPLDIRSIFLGVDHHVRKEATLRQVFAGGKIRAQIAHGEVMYKDSWVSRFSENPYLSVGQVPTWEPEDFLEGEEAIGKTLETVSEIRALVESCFQT